MTHIARKAAFLTTLLLLTPALPALAQQMIYSDEHSESCLQAGQSQQEREACIGVSANACMEDTEGGFSTAGMVSCLSLELDYWDRRLNAAYRDLMRREKADDAEFGAGQNGVPSKAKALRAMQRAWIPYRDASCAYARAQWGGGTGGGPAELSCLLQMTGEQALRLENPSGQN